MNWKPMNVKGHGYRTPIATGSLHSFSLHRVSSCYCGLMIQNHIYKPIEKVVYVCTCILIYLIYYLS